MKLWTRKRCTVCGKNKRREQYYLARKDRLGRRPECKSCTNAANARWAKKNPSKVRAIKARYRSYDVSVQKEREYSRWRLIRINYGLGREEYEAMLAAQNGRCAICETPFGKGRALGPHIDHCHASNRVRALLCARCNSGLGQFRDNPKFLAHAITYLEKHR